VRGLARAVVGLLQTGVDFARGLGQLTPRRHVDDGAFLHGPVERAGHHDHYAALGSDASSESELDPAGGFDYAAEIGVLRLVDGPCRSVDEGAPQKPGVPASS